MEFGCVNRGSKEFKNLAARNNVSVGTLELITHKYWLETNSDKNFPTDIYIQAQLGNKEYLENIPEVRQLWKRDYQTPQRFDTFEQLQAARKELTNYFPEGAIVHYTDASGKHVLAVMKPVEKLSSSSKDFFSEDHTKKLDLGLSEKGTYTIDKVQELFNRFNTDRTSKHLADKVFSIAKQLGLQIKFSDNLPDMVGGRTSGSEITFYKDFLESDAKNDSKPWLLLHEVIHALTNYALSDVTKDHISPAHAKQLQEFRSEINKVYREVMRDPNLITEYALTSVNEFVAELANPVFRDKLKAAKPKQSLWQKVVSAFKSLLGIHADNYYERSMKALDKALNAFDLDGYLAYNGMKEILRKAYDNHQVDFENMSEQELKSMLTKEIETQRSAIKQGTSTLNNNQLKNQISNESRQEVQSRRLVQPALPGGLQINWRQEGSRGRSESGSQIQASRVGNDSRGTRQNGDNVAQQVSNVSQAIDKKLASKGVKATSQPVKQASSQEFHDAIAKAKRENPNGWMVDVHDVSDYDNCLTMLTEDGRSGIAVTQDGDIISVFSGVSGDHRLEKLMQMAIAAGGKKLDCYYLTENGSTKGLPFIYSRYGFKVDAVTPFNEEYAPQEFQEWQQRNPDRRVAGVAAMSLRVADSIDGYSRDNTPDIDKAQTFEGENGYDEALKHRDQQLAAFEKQAAHDTSTQREVLHALTDKMQEADIPVSYDSEASTTVDTADKLTKLMLAYHGSEADFDAFDNSHMGEGEGLQAHGYGMYFALDRATSVGYALMHRNAALENSRATRNFREAGNNYNFIRYQQEGKQRPWFAFTISSASGKKFNFIDLVNGKSSFMRSTTGKLYSLFEDANTKFLNKEHRTATPEELLAQAKEELQSKIDSREAQLKEADPESRAYSEIRIMLAGLKAQQKLLGTVQIMPQAEVSTHLDARLQKARQEYEQAKAEYDNAKVEAAATPAILYTLELSDSNKYIEQKKKYTVDSKEFKDIEAALAKRGAEFTPSIRQKIANDGFITGSNLYSSLATSLGSSRNASKFLESLGYSGVKYTGAADGDCVVVFNAKDVKIKDKKRLFQTSKGEVLGYTDGKSVHLDAKKATPETAVHEYTHLWAEAMRKGNAKEWDNIVYLMKKEKGLWDYVTNVYSDLTNDSDIAEEVLAHYSGKQGDARLREEAQRITEENPKLKASKIVSTVRNALNRFWRQVADFFNVHFTTAQEVADQVLGDLLNGVNPTSLTDTSAEGRLSAMIDSMSKDQLVGELNQLKQEQTDFNLTDDSFKKTSSRGPSTFTFKDGTTVPTPFAPNEQQVEALNVMADFMKSDPMATGERVMTLAGYAGTGKTSLMEIMQEWSGRQRTGDFVKFCATTHAATAVLRKKVTGRAVTANKMFGIKVEVDYSKPYDANNVKSSSASVQLRPGSTVVVDEASMLSVDNYNAIMTIARRQNVKVIFVGDPAQLPPVGETKISKVFRQSDGKTLQLTKVERTDENAILKEATDLRNGEKLTLESSFNDEGRGVAYVKPKGKHSEYRDALIKKFIPMLKDNPTLFRILAFTNKKVQYYNEYARQLLGYEDNTPRVGEPILGYTNWGYDPDTREPLFINSGSYTVAAVYPPVRKMCTAVRGFKWSLDVTPVAMVDNLGEYHTFEFIDIKGNAHNREIATKLANFKAEAWNNYFRYKGRDSRAASDARKTANAIEKFLFVNDDITDPHNPKVTWQKKVWDFGYAMTIHKSQGSTFTHVMVDATDIDVSGSGKRKAARTSPTGVPDFAPDMDVSRRPVQPTAEELANGKVTSSADFDFTSEEVAEAQKQVQAQAEQERDNEEVADLNQSLQYVAVTRATDTVTILTPDAKTEDSPLQHLGDPNKKKTTPVEGQKAPEQPKQTKAKLNLTPATSKDAKANAKGKLANKFIGFADGINGSSTAEYARQAGKSANTGEYSPEDTVFASMPNEGGSDATRAQQQAKTIEEALKALDSGATLVTDSESLINSTYNNEGDKKLVEALKKHGVTYSEVVKDGHTVGLWKKDANKQPAQQAPAESKQPSSTESSPESAKTLQQYVEEYDNDIKENVQGHFKNLLHEEGIRSVLFDGSSFEVRVKTADKNVDCLIYLKDGHFVVDILPAVDYNGTEDVTLGMSFPSREAMQEVVDRFIPKELQEYFANQYEQDSKYDYTTLTEKARKKFGTVTSDEALAYLANNSKVNKFLYDKYGITWYNPATGQRYGDSAEMVTWRSNYEPVMVDANTGTVHNSKKQTIDINNIPPKPQISTATPSQSTTAATPTRIHLADSQPRQVSYTVDGKRQLFTVSKQNGRWVIMNSEGKEVYANDGMDRRKVLANTMVQNGDMVVVEHDGEKYIVDQDGRILSMKTMQSVYVGIHGTREEMLAKGYILMKARKVFNEIEKNMVQSPDASKIANQTEAFGVEFHRGRITPQTADEWLGQHPDGIVAYRVALQNGEAFNTPSQVEKGIIGNPFNWQDRNIGPVKATQMFMDWLVTGNNFGEPKATEAYRQAIIQKLLSIEAGKQNILYYKELGYPSHATVLGYLINHKELIGGKREQSLTPEELAAQQQQEVTTQVVQQLGKIGGIEVQTVVGQEAMREQMQKDSGEEVDYSKGTGRTIHNSDQGESRRGDNDRLGRKDKGTSEVDYFKRPDGTVYGYATSTGRIVLDTSVIRPEHPIHEYTHVWDRVLAKNHKALWDKGKSLMKEFDGGKLWNEIANSEDYGKQWQGLSKEEFEDRVATEVHARLVGEEGAKLLDKIGKEKGRSDIIAKLKDWLLSAWKALKGTYSSWTPKDIDSLTLEDFNHMTIRDFADALDLSKVKPVEASKEEGGRAEEKPPIEGLTADESQHYRDTGKVDLPGYQSFINSMEETAVDEAWKIPMLKELDNQLSTENSFEENKEIADKMEAVLKAKDPSELKGQEAERKQQAEAEIDDYDAVNTQLNNLLEGKFRPDGDVGKSYGGKAVTMREIIDEGLVDVDSEFTPSDIAEVANDVANYMSDIISDIQADVENLKKYFPDLKVKEGTDTTKMTRLEIINLIGMDNLVSKAKKDFTTDGEIADFGDDTTAYRSALLGENWDALMSYVNPNFVFNENVGITRDHRKKTYGVDKNKHELNYDENGNAIDSDTQTETQDTQQSWQIDQLTVDVMSKMSMLVKQAIHECYVLDKDNKPVVGKQWKVKKRVDPRVATNQLLNWCNGALTIQSMIKKLQAKQSNNPWVKQLIERLSDDSGNNADFQSQFFGLFDKARNLYSIVRKIDYGKTYSCAVLNDHPALDEALDALKAKTKLGVAPIMTQAGKIDRKLLGPTEKEGIDDSYFNLNAAAHRLNEIVSEYDQIFRKGHYNRLGKNNFTEEDAKQISKLKDEAAEKLAAICTAIGYDVTKEMVSDVLIDDAVFRNMVAYADYLRTDLGKGLKLEDAGRRYDPYAFGEKSIISSVTNLIQPFTDQLEDGLTNTVFDSGKMYQTYTAPSFMHTLVDKLHSEDALDFIEQHFKSSEFFYDKETGEYRLPMLEEFARNSGARRQFDIRTELNFNKHNYMKTMSPIEYQLSILANYFSLPFKAATGNRSMAFYRMPMRGNKPANEYWKGARFTGPTYKESIVDNLFAIFCQELSRIQTTKMRNKEEGDAGFIANWDTKGREFNFLDFFNSYLKDGKADKEGRTLLEGKDNDTLAELIQRKVDVNSKKLTAEEEAKLNELANKAIMNYMERYAQESLAKHEVDGLIKQAAKVQYLIPVEFQNKGLNEQQLHDVVRNQIEEFLWNDYLATQEILELTVGDTAFYKDAEDLQKRYAQLHASGTKANIYATDYKGNRVSDGTYRTVVLKDASKFVSDTIDNIAEVFDRIIERVEPDQKEGWKVLKDSLVGEKGEYRRINVTDGQGLDSPSSFRKKALMFGEWSAEKENLYQSILSGNYNFSDLKNAFQVKKPFVYGHLAKNVGVTTADGEASPIQTVQVPMQAKNSEYMLIMADAFLQGEAKKGNVATKPNLLRAIYRVMEESERLNPTKGIDTVQYESAIKSGCQDTVDLTQFADDVEHGEDNAYEYMMDCLYRLDEGGNRTTEYNTDSYVNETSYDNYVIQQEVPAEFMNHEQAIGSQTRMIVDSDLSLDATWDVPYGDGTSKSYSTSDLVAEYEQLNAANINESLYELTEELHLDPYKYSRRETNLALSKILQREIQSSPRYGADLMQACQVDKATGEFRIPIGDPVQSKRIEQLINSIIKNRVNKQKMPGGPVVQVTNYGTSTRLHIKFKDKNGGLLKLKEEFEQDDALKKQYGTYKNYIHERQDGIAHFEVFAPMWSKEIFTKFADEHGNIDMEALEAANPELTKMISYRIPTEDKYSMAPMKVVGFMPKEAGEAIMLPYELTTIDDSDFDVDKRYIMRKDYRIVTKEKADIAKTMFDKAVADYPQSFKSEESKSFLKQRIEDYLAKRDKLDDFAMRRKSKEVHGQLYNMVLKSYADSHDGKVPYGIKQQINDNVKMFLDNPEAMRQSGDALTAFVARQYDQMAYMNELYRRTAYTTDNPTSGRRYRNNRILDIMYTVLTHESVASQILNPGGFAAAKRMGYLVSAFKNSGHSWEDLKKMSTDDLKKLSYTSKNIAQFDTQVQFYKQNSACSSLIGVFAVNKVAHAALCYDGMYIVSPTFTIAGVTIQTGTKVDAVYDTEGNFIGKTIGSLVSASADGVKDPVLNLMNINMTTANVLNTLLRLGMPFDKAALFMSQDAITRMLTEFDKRNVDGYTPLDRLLTEFVSAYQKKYHLDTKSKINDEELTEEELIEGLKSFDRATASEAEKERRDAIDYKVIITLQKVLALSDILRNPTFVTRFNSISSAVGPQVIDNLVLRDKMNKFSAVANAERKNFDTSLYYEGTGAMVTLESMLADHPILDAFSGAVNTAETLLHDMPTNSVQFSQVLNSIPDNLKTVFFGNRKMLGQLADFFNSYLLVANGVVDAKDLHKFIVDFPREFVTKAYDKRYPNNELIKAITPDTTKSGRTILKVDLNKLDQKQKDRLSSAWTSLYKADKDLAIGLFKYCFFRAGINFSPKTFMSLLPNYIRENMSTTVETDNGGAKTVHYLDTFRHLPPIVGARVYDQFVRNNWDNKRLAPDMPKGTKGNFDLKKGQCTITDESSVKAMSDMVYFTTKQGKKTYLWRYLPTADGVLTFEAVSPLGNNKEYLEISTEDIKEPMDTPAEPDGSNEAPTTEEPAEDPALFAPERPAADNDQVEHNVDAFIKLYQNAYPKVTEAQGRNFFEVFRKNPRKYVGVLSYVFSQRGLHLDTEGVLKEFNKFCH